ncbi:MAG TPA: hypothetical protein VEW48_24375 [Thermoanaerobaculia bacterium]|nr:hypothetical protein [Thermoanaerobaculia bacterium]
MRSFRGLIPLLLLVASLVPASGGAAPLRDVLGVTHVAGKYNFTAEDFLNEGADRLLELGTRVIKVWFDPNATPSYPFNSDWGAPPENLADLARHPYYQALFAKPFSTYILELARRDPIDEFLDGMTREEMDKERKQTYELARYLLTTYAGTGKTFVLQNWEGDHLLRRGLTDDEQPDHTRVLGMAAWLNARQAGVTQARREVSAQGVTVANAVEVNLLRRAMAGEVTVTNDVVPLTRADLYSYSSWDVELDPAGLVHALDYLAAKAPDSSLYGSRNVYLGEYGAAKDHVSNEQDRARVIRELTEAALGWGARWVVYWQLYCNEPAREYQTDRPANQDLRGFWLIRPDGVKTRFYNYFSGQLETSLDRVYLRAPGDRYVTPEDGGGGAVSTDPLPSPDSALMFRDLDGGPLRNGDSVQILAHSGIYLRVAEDGRVLADRRETGSATTFVIRKIGATGRAVLGPADRLAIETPGGHYLGAGADGRLRDVGGRPGAEGTFSILFAE